MKLLILGLAAVLAGCSGAQELSSSWRSEGASAGRGTYFKDQNISVDVQNDGEYLYLTVDFGEGGRQILWRGFTVWLDRDGGQDRQFGIRYPVGMTMPRGGETEDEPGGAPDLLASVPPELEILGPGADDHQRMNIGQAGGINASIEDRNGTMRYRGRIPLADTGAHRFAIGTRPGAVIGLGLEVAGRGERPEGERPEGMGRRGGYGGGRRGGGGGGGGYQRSGNRRPEPLELWAKVTLANQP